MRDEFTTSSLDHGSGDGSDDVAVVIAYSGRWWPNATDVQEAIRTQKNRLIEPLSLQHGRHRVLIALATTATQWCSPSTHLLASGVWPNSAADAALTAEVQMAFPEYAVVARTFAEPDAALDAVPSAVNASLRHFGPLNGSRVDPDYDVSSMQSWLAQMIGLRHAASLRNHVEWARTASRVVIARSRIDVVYPDTAGFVMPSYDPGVVYVEPGWWPTNDREPARPAEWRDFTFVFSGTSCLDVLGTPSILSANTTPFFKLDNDTRAYGLRAEEQTLLWLRDGGCSVAPLTGVYRPTTYPAPVNAQLSNTGGRIGSRLIRERHHKSLWECHI